MKVFMRILFSVLLLGSFFVSSCEADEVDVINNFYGGLADIIEQNRNNPDQCVAMAEDFIRKNAQSVNDAAQSASQKQPTEEDAQRMMNESPMQSRSRMGAMERFSLVFGIFAQKHPEQAAKIQQVVAEYQQK